MKRSSAHLLVNVPLWECDVHFVTARTMAGALAAARRRWPALSADLASLSHDDEGAVMVLPGEAGVLALLPSDAKPGVVAHECLHAAVRVLDRAGVKVSARDDEPLAYTLGWLVDRATPWLARAGATLRA